MLEKIYDKYIIHLLIITFLTQLLVLGSSIKLINRANNVKVLDLNQELEISRELSNYSLGLENIFTNKGTEKAL